MGVFVKFFCVVFSKLFRVRDKQRVCFSVFCFPSCSDLVRSSVCVCQGGSPSTEGSPHSWLFLGAQQSRSSPTSEVCFVPKGREGVKNHPFWVTVYWSVIMPCFTMQCFSNSTDVFKLIVSDRIQERHDSCYERQKITKGSDKRYRSVNRKNKTRGKLCRSL